jgi:hypothetical protein
LQKNKTAGQKEAFRVAVSSLFVNPFIGSQKSWKRYAYEYERQFSAIFKILREKYCLPGLNFDRNSYLIFYGRIDINFSFLSFN